MLVTRQALYGPRVNNRVNANLNRALSSKGLIDCRNSLQIWRMNKEPKIYRHLS